MLSTPVLIPDFVWAQDSKCVIITIQFGGFIAQRKQHPCHAAFYGTRVSLTKQREYLHDCKGERYSLNLYLQQEILPDQSYCIESGRKIQLMLKKRAVGFWKHVLTKECFDSYKNKIKPDYELWVDGDDEDDLYSKFWPSVHSLVFESLQLFPSALCLLICSYIQE